MNHIDVIRLHAIGSLPAVGLSGNRSQRRGAGVARQVHILEVIGSSPIVATRSS